MIRLQAFLERYWFILGTLTISASFAFFYYYLNFNIVIFIWIALLTGAFIAGFILSAARSTPQQLKVAVAVSESFVDLFKMSASPT